MEGPKAMFDYERQGTDPVGKGFEEACVGDGSEGGSSTFVESVSDPLVEQVFPLALGACSVVKPDDGLNSFHVSAPVEKGDASFFVFEVLCGFDHVASVGKFRAYRLGIELGVLGPG